MLKQIIVRRNRRIDVMVATDDMFWSITLVDNSTIPPFFIFSHALLYQLRFKFTEGQKRRFVLISCFFLIWNQANHISMTDFWAAAASPVCMFIYLSLHPPWDSLLTPQSRAWSSDPFYQTPPRFPIFVDQSPLAGTWPTPQSLRPITWLLRHT
mgnify:CR=1 FL=1